MRFFQLEEYLLCGQMLTGAVYDVEYFFVIFCHEALFSILHKLEVF